MQLTIKQIVDVIIKNELGYANTRKLDDDICVSCVELDSRKIQAGGVFIATPGEKVDGHSFIGQVIEKGAKLIISQKTVDELVNEYGLEESNFPSIAVVSDSFKALKEIGAYYRSTLKIPVVGITGSVGKTSTKEFIAGVLGEKYSVLKTAGNYNNEIGVPLTLLQIREEHEVAVVEMGINHFGEMEELARMAAPTMAVITNIGPCHLENLGDLNGVLKAKSQIFANLTDDGEVVLYGEDELLNTVKTVSNGKKPHRFGLNAANGEASIEVVKQLGLLGSKCMLKLDGECAEVNVPLPGFHMTINAAAAALVGKLLGMSFKEILSGIESMKPISGRNQIIKLKDLTLIDDCYNANPVSMKSSIDLLKMGTGDTVAILGDMFELGANEVSLHAQVGEYAAKKNITRLLCAGSLSKNMYEAALAALAENDETKTQVLWWPSREEMIEAIRKDFAEERVLIPEGSSVLVKASHGMKFPEVTDTLRELNS